MLTTTEFVRAFEAVTVDDFKAWLDKHPDEDFTIAAREALKAHGNYSCACVMGRFYTDTLGYEIYVGVAVGWRKSTNEYSVANMPRPFRAIVEHFDKHYRQKLPFTAQDALHYLELP